MRSRIFFILIILLTFTLYADGNSNIQGQLNNTPFGEKSSATSIPKKSVSNIGNILATGIAADKIPQNLRGLWEGKDRIVFIEQLDDSSSPEIVIILKDFYGWYYDRVVEPQNYSIQYPIKRNAATTKNPEHVFVDVSPVDKSLLENTIEIKLLFSKHQKTIVPLAIIEDNIFTDFYVRDSEDYNYYRGVAVSQGITASEQRIPQEITSYYIDGEDVYKIRYWITDMEYSDRKVRLNYGDKSFEIDAHIYSAGHNYACVPGRSNTVRNVCPPEKLDDSYIFAEDDTILIKNHEPYLTKLADKDDFTQLMEIVEKANSRRRPPASPLFPESNVDFYWNIIDYLEKDVKLIQEVRRRQESFGIRGKDINQ